MGSSRSLAAQVSARAPETFEEWAERSANEAKLRKFARHPDVQRDPDQYVAAVRKLQRKAYARFGP
jgi:hypothetical protein